MLNRKNEFFAFMQEREAIRLRKEAGDFPPWTDDPILSVYKFTNVFRHHDKTSKVLIDTFYRKHYYDNKETILMNCALFRYFGTWEFAQAVGWQKYETFNFESIKETAQERLGKERVFTGAYVITNQGISAPKSEVVVDYFLKALHAKAPRIVEIANETQEWEMVALEMSGILGFGGTGFMTKEILLDTTYTAFWKNQRVNGFSYPEDWDRWTPVGPGARRGASRVSGDDDAKALSRLASFEIIMELHYLQDAFWDGSKLSPHDVQFQLCEFDKYERVRLGQGRPRSRYHYA